MGALKFKATLVPRGPAAAVILDDEQVATVGEGAKRFPVAATVNGHTFRTTVVRMSGDFLLGFNRADRTAAGVEAGDLIEVDLALDTAPRVVAEPTQLKDALDGDPELRERFDALSYTNRKEFARWIAEAKREETRERRLASALEMIRDGRTRS